MGLPLLSGNECRREAYPSLPFAEWCFASFVIWIKLCKSVARRLILIVAFIIFSFEVQLSFFVLRNQWFIATITVFTPPPVLKYLNLLSDSQVRRLLNTNNVIAAPILPREYNERAGHSPENSACDKRRRKESLLPCRFDSQGRFKYYTLGLPFKCREHVPRSGIFFLCLRWTGSVYAPLLSCIDCFGNIFRLVV